MNADDEKNLLRIWDSEMTRMTAMHEAYALGRARGMTEAVVESSGDELVRELTRVVFPSLRDYGQGYSAAVAERAAARITQDAQEKAALKAELASVKAHAEAMAKALDDGQNFGAWQPVVDAYRAAYPKE